MVSANGVNHCPAMPPMNAIGMNTTTIEKRRRGDRQADLVGAFVRGLEVVLAHLDVAHDVLAHHDRVVDQDADGQRQAEQRHRVEREAERPHGDERREHRDRQRQAGDDRRAPRVEEQEHDQHGERRAFDQRLLDVAAPSRRRARRRRARRAASRRPAASRWISSTCARTPLGDGGRAEARGLQDVDADRLFAVVERRPSAAPRCRPARRPRRRAGRRGRCDCATTSCLKSAGESRRPLRRIVRSSSCPSRRPTGAARFCDLQRLHHLPDARRRRPADRAGRISTASSRSMAPTTFTSATPGMPRSRRVMSGSAMPRQLGAASASCDDSVSETIGRSAGSNCVRIGSSISGGRSLRICRDLVANLLRRLLQVLRRSRTRR